MTDISSKSASCGVLAVSVLCFALASSAAGALESVASEARLALRADHMVLDAATDGSRLLVATQSGHVDVYDWTSGEAHPPLLITEALAGQAFAPTVRSVAVSPSGRSVAAVSSDSGLYLLSPTPAGVQRQWLGEKPGAMLVRFLDEERLLLADMRGELALLDAATGREHYRRQLDLDPVYALALSPDRSRLAVALRSSGIQIVDPETGETRQNLHGHRDSVFALAWLSDRELVSGGKDKHVLLWDLGREEPTSRPLYVGDHYVTALASHAAGALLALPIGEFSVGIYRLPEGRLTRRFDGHTAPIQSLIFVDEGRRLISAGHDARIFVWSLASPEEDPSP